jgi:hypothetical protein
LDQDDVLLASWCEAMAILLALPIEAGDLTTIQTNLRFIVNQIKCVGEFPLPESVEPANIFRA